MHTYALLAALSLVGPFALFKWYGRETVLERTKATIAFVSLLGPSRRSTEYELINVFLPGNRSMILEVPLDRFVQFKSNPFIEANVTISQTAFGAPYVSSVEWPGEATSSPGAKKNDGLYLGVAYLMLGMLATVYALQPSVYADLGRLGTAFGGLLIMLSGYALATLHMKPLTTDARVDMFGGLLSLGSGRQSVVLATVIACALTVSCYWYGGVGLFFGLNIGCAAGMLLGLLCKPSPAPQLTITG